MKSKNFITLLDIPKEELRQLILRAIELKKMTKNSIIDPDELYKKLISEKDQGYQMVKEEIEDGIVDEDSEEKTEDENNAENESDEKGE